MLYNSKRTIISMALGILLLIAYAVYALGDTSPAPDDLKAWALVMLIFIGAGIVAAIIIQILFHIVFAIGIAVKEKDCDDEKVERIIKSTMVEDERDKLIGLKAARIGYSCTCFGFIIGLAALAAGISVVAAFHIMVGAVAVGSFIEGGVSVYLNERGVCNG